MVRIEPVQAFSDNYIWLLYQDDCRQALVVDPGDATPVIEALEERGLRLVSILITHHHFDHVGGLATLRERYSPHVYGPHNPAIEGIDTRLGEGDRISVLGLDFDVMEVPGHTLDHIAFYHRGEQPILFCGDTLFAGGCGRVFEGDPAMMHRSLQRLANLPAATRVYCAHEYTLANLRFARAVEPDNAALAARLGTAESLRERGEPTVPSKLSLELETNPFLRCATAELRDSLEQQGRLKGAGAAEVFATVRGWKDTF
ncbi:MAG: hydroxyacylglutathione hydrolase [Halioglobus sp.]|nr:hydroxyacylglutathione hydrolase [Halioglobus sp.]